MWYFLNKKIVLLLQYQKIKLVTLKYYYYEQNCKKTNRLGR